VIVAEHYCIHNRFIVYTINFYRNGCL